MVETAISHSGSEAQSPPCPCLELAVVLFMERKWTIVIELCLQQSVVLCVCLCLSHCPMHCGKNGWLDTDAVWDGRLDRWEVQDCPSNFGTSHIATPHRHPSHAPTQPAATTVHHYCTATLQTPHWLQWGTPHSPQKLPPPMDRSQNPSNCLIPGPPCMRLLLICLRSCNR